mmetsp:Transcript_2918/g.7257  ORF Transcript_2918/g.7257 Transcript_2918/m.7257 type:complete len:236 (-) Transcript_2918:404-1111(-)
MAWGLSGSAPGDPRRTLPPGAQWHPPPSPSSPPRCPASPWPAPTRAPRASGRRARRLPQGRSIRESAGARGRLHRPGRETSGAAAAAGAYGTHSAALRPAHCPPRKTPRRLGYLRRGAAPSRPTGSTAGRGGRVRSGRCGWWLLRLPPRRLTLPPPASRARPPARGCTRLRTAPRAPSPPCRRPRTCRCRGARCSTRGARPAPPRSGGRTEGPRNWRQRRWKERADRWCRDPWGS